MTPQYSNYQNSALEDFAPMDGRVQPVAPQATTPAPVPPPPPVATTPAPIDSAMSVENLYYQILGRAPDAGGLAYWQNAFGSSADPTEQASFMQAAQSELANRSAQEQALLAPKVVDPVATGVSNQAIVDWFKANPNADDATIARTMKEAAVTPEQVAKATGTNYADVNNRYLAATQQPPAALSPVAVQQQIIADERKRATDGIASLDTSLTPTKPPPKQIIESNAPVDLGDGTFRTRGGQLIDKEGYPVTDVAALYQKYLGRAPESQSAIDFWKKEFGSSLDPSEIAKFEAAANTEKANTKTVNDLYASIGRTGVGTETNQIDQGGLQYWTDKLKSGMTPDQVKAEFQTAVNDFLTTKKDDPYSKYVAPTYLKTITDNIAKDTTLSAFDKNNKIFETAQKYGMDDAAIDKAFGKTAADAYRTQYGTQIKDWITTTLAKDEGTTFDEIANIKNAARQFGLDADEIVKYSGLNKTGVTTLFDAYDKGLASLAKGFEDAKTKAGDDTAALSTAEVNKAKTLLALQSQYKVTDEDLAKAGNTTVKAVQDYLNPIKDAPKTLESLMTNNTMSGADIRAKIEELKKNPAISGIYSAALQKFSDNAAKDYSGTYGNKNYESLNPLAVSTVLSQLKAQQEAGTAQYYQGGAKDGKKGGFGSLDAMTEDMAKNLVAAGITDIRQVGQKTITEKDEDDNDVTRTITINKVTGEPINKASNYAERTTGNSWSGTFKGKGNTGYNVQFDKSGNPIFYTTGASSSDMQDLMPILAMASFIPGAAPFVAAINAAYAASEGNWKQAILSSLPAVGELANMAGASANTVANIGTASKVANVANAINNKDLLSLAMSGTSLASDKNMFGEGAFNPKANVLGDFSTKDLLSGASIAKAIDNKDYASLANIAAQMSGSKDAVTAAKGLSMIKALESKNPMAIAQMATKLNLTNDVIGKAGGGLASLPGLIKNSGRDTLTDKTAFDGLNGSLVAKMLNKQPPAIRAAMLKQMTQAA